MTEHWWASKQTISAMKIGWLAPCEHRQGTARAAGDDRHTIHVHFEDYDDSRILVAHCARSLRPVFVKDGEIGLFFVRTGPSTTELTGSQTQEFISHRMMRELTVVLGRRVLVQTLSAIPIFEKSR